MNPVCAICKGKESRKKRRRATEERSDEDEEVVQCSECKKYGKLGFVLSFTLAELEHLWFFFFIKTN